MTNPWGSLTALDIENIQTSGRVQYLVDAQIQERFAQEQFDVIFFIHCLQPTGEKQKQKVLLIPPEEFEKDQDTETTWFQSDRHKSILGEMASSATPKIVDLRTRQSSIKNQAGRGTCVAHACMGLLEFFKHIPDDLSEQYTHYKFNEFMQQSHARNFGVVTLDAADFLSRKNGYICTEADWPYITTQDRIIELLEDNAYKPPQAAIDNQIYGIADYHLILDKGSSGESIKNTDFLEALIANGYPIVVGSWVSWNDIDNDGVLDPVLDENGNPIRKGGHAMLLLGYNRHEQYFIAKNSWGPNWGHNGYAYLHYNLARACFKYGFVVDQVVPASSELPGKLDKVTCKFSPICQAWQRFVSWLKGKNISS